LQVQSDSYNATHGKAATIITMLAIFVPLFFDTIKDTKEFIIWLSLIPFISISISLISMIYVLFPRKMVHNFNKEEFNKTVKKTKLEYLGSAEKLYNR